MVLRNLKKFCKIFIILLPLVILNCFSFEKVNINRNLSIEEKELVKNNYFALLEIPQINLKKELYNINDKKNDVNKNIYVHPTSIFPNNIILAGHSGNTKYSYFNNLKKLKTNDIIKIYYENKIYEYKIKRVEEQNKTGTLYLKEDKAERLILITCHLKHNTQMIYYSYLANIKEI